MKRGMQRHRAWSMVIVVAGALAGCTSSGSGESEIPEAPPGSDGGAAAEPRSPGRTPSEAGVEQTGNSNSSGLRVHVVRKDDTLFSLARQYYNDQSKWRKILTANHIPIEKKDQIKIGQELVIPD